MSSRRAELVLEILRERGPSRAEDVGPELAARGGTKAKDPVVSARDALRWDSGIVELLDGRWMALIWALDGVVLPHRVLPQERERSCLRLDPDLTVLAPLVWSGVLRSPVGELRIVADGINDRALDPVKSVPDRFLALPYGVGRRLVPGSMVGVAIRGGTLDLVRLDDPEPASMETIAVLEEVGALCWAGRGGHIRTDRSPWTIFWWRRPPSCRTCFEGSQSRSGTRSGVAACPPAGISWARP